MIFTVAIDGPAAAGKGTVSKVVAAHFGFAHLDTGLLYRGVGKKNLDGKDPVEAAQQLNAEDLDPSVLRTAEVAQAASKIAVIPEVRAALLEFQKNFARRKGGAVLDGRDIGTVICPNAEAKLFVTASAEVRAERRFLELFAKDGSVTREKVLTDVIARDTRDSQRDVAPLKPADNAHVIDTSDMTIDQATQAAIEFVQSRLADLL